MGGGDIPVPKKRSRSALDHHLSRRRRRRAVDFLVGFSRR